MRHRCLKTTFLHKVLGLKQILGYTEVRTFHWMGPMADLFEQCNPVIVVSNRNVCRRLLNKEVQCWFPPFCNIDEPYSANTY